MNRNKKGQFIKEHIPWNKNKQGVQKYTKITAEKIREKLIGIKRSLNTRLKMSKALKNKSYEEIYGIREADRQRNKRREAQKGMKYTEESKRRMSLSGGGTGIPRELSEYGTEFDSALKEQVRFRDHYKCQICDCSQLENGRQLDVHHIDYNKENNILINLIALCMRCHRKTNYNREYWEYFLCQKKNLLLLLKLLIIG